MSARKSRTIVSEVDAIEQRAAQTRVARMLAVARKERLPVPVLAERYSMEPRAVQKALQAAGVKVDTELLNLRAPRRAAGGGR